MRPLYDDRDLTFVLTSWANGSLDQFHGTAKPIAGLQNCYVSGTGIRPYSLVERITSEDVDRAIAALFAQEQTRWQAIILSMVFLKGRTIEAVGRVLGCAYSMQATSKFLEAKDRLMEVLLAQE